MDSSKTNRCNQRIWTNGDRVRFFSALKGRWFRGKIIKVLENENNNDIALKIQYTIGTLKKTKKITASKQNIINCIEPLNKQKAKLKIKEFDKKLFLCPFDKHRLCIIGFIRKIENTFKNLQIPLEIHNIIYHFYVLYKFRLIFCDKNGYIDQRKYIERGLMKKHFNLKNLYVTLRDELFENNANASNDQRLPEIHLWAKYGAVKKIYRIHKNVAVTEQEILSLYQNKWVEIAYDYLQTDLNNLTIAVERRNDDGTWPRTKGDDWINLECGDILEVKNNDNNKWYESMIRYVYPKQHNLYGYVVVHYIGVEDEKDHVLSIISNIDRFASRYTHTNINGAYGSFIPIDNLPYHLYVVIKSIIHKIELQPQQQTYLTLESFMEIIRAKLRLYYCDFEVITCSGFKIKNETLLKRIVPYYANNLIVIPKKTKNNKKVYKPRWKMNSNGVYKAS